VAELEPLLPVKAACELVGQPRSTLYRQRHPRAALTSPTAGHRRPWMDRHCP
jgi:hypothetical protein